MVRMNLRPKAMFLNADSGADVGYKDRANQAVEGLPVSIRAGTVPKIRYIKRRRGLEKADDS
jgi:hypothetical protein